MESVSSSARDSSALENSAVIRPDHNAQEEAATKNYGICGDCLGPALGRLNARPSEAKSVPARVRRPVRMVTVPRS